MLNSYKDSSVKKEDCAKENYVSLRMHDCLIIEGGKKRGIKQTVKEDLKCYSITYSCYHGGRKFKLQTKGIRLNQKYSVHTHSRR